METRERRSSIAAAKPLNLTRLLDGPGSNGEFNTCVKEVQLSVSGTFAKEDYPGLDAN